MRGNKVDVDVDLESKYQELYYHMHMTRVDLGSGGPRYLFCYSIKRKFGILQVPYSLRVSSRVSE